MALLALICAIERCGTTVQVRIAENDYGYVRYALAVLRTPRQGSVKLCDQSKLFCELGQVCNFEAKRFPFARGAFSDFGIVERFQRRIDAAGSALFDQGREDCRAGAIIKCVRIEQVGNVIDVLAPIAPADGLLQQGPQWSEW